MTLGNKLDIIVTIPILGSKFSDSKKYGHCSNIHMENVKRSTIKERKRPSVL